MLSIALNPGFVMLVGALIVLALPQALRAPVMALSCIGALGLLLTPDFGRYDAFAQIGLQMVPLTLDELNQVFGIAFIGAGILISIYASGRNQRYEDAAILMLIGAATSALFVGDLVSFVAAAELAGLAAAWIVFCAGGQAAQAAGVRLLLWLGLEGLLLLSGVAFILSDGLQNTFGQMDARTVGGALFLGGLAIRIGAPLAHVWLKDVVSQASPAGSVALAVLPALIGLYALARAFPGEQSLLYVGVGMLGIAAAYAFAEDDLRRAAGYALTAQIGAAAVAIGLGAPQALAGAAAHGFAIVFGFTLLFMALGVFVRVHGTASAAALAGAGRSAPASTLLLLAGGLAAAAAPGFAGYASFATIRDAASHGPLWLAPALLATSALALAHTVLRPVLAVLDGPKPTSPPGAPVFTMLLAAGIAAFICLVVGVAPSWLYGLTPPALMRFQPFSGALITPYLAAAGAAGAGWLTLRLIGLAPRERPIRVLDLDALYGGPLAGIGRWTGVVMLRLYGVWQTVSALAADRAGRAFTAFARGGDRPYRDNWSGALSFAAIAVLLALIFVASG